jgi:hypothetical protein
MIRNKFKEVIIRWSRKIEEQTLHIVPLEETFVLSVACQSLGIRQNPDTATSCGQVKFYGGW